MLGAHNKAIIFDMDGTIIKTEHIWDKVTYETLNRYNITLTSDEFTNFRKSIIGMSRENSAATMKKLFNISNPLEQIMDTESALAVKLFQSNLEYFDGFEAFHQKLIDQKIPNAIATNSSPNHLETVRKSINLAARFGNHIYSIADVNFKAKPNPAVFLHTAKQLGVKPEACIVFEDSLHGFNAAKSAGMRCIAIKNNQNIHLLNHVAKSIESFHEAEEALKNL